MAKLGRRKIPEKDKRKHPVTCRLTDLELEEVSAKKPVKMRTGEYIRLAALSHHLKIQKIPAINQELRVEMGRIGNNVNQIAKALNTGLDVRLDTLIDIITSIQNQIKIVRSELVAK